VILSQTGTSDLKIRLQIAEEVDAGDRVREPAGTSEGIVGSKATDSSTYHFYDAGTDAGKKKRKGAATADAEEEEPPEKRKAKSKTANGSKAKGSSLVTFTSSLQSCNCQKFGG